MSDRILITGSHAQLGTELGWKADETFDTGIIKTVEWYLKG